MEKPEIEMTFCRLCLSIICNENFKVIENTIKQVLDVLLLKLNVEENIIPVICCTCSIKLFAAYEFKLTCKDTEERIFSYINSENEAPVDLRQIYLKETNKEHLRSVLEDERICRLCMQTVTCGFTSLNTLEIDMIRKYILEVNFNFTKEPVICSPCLDSLNTHSDFLKNCLDVQEQEEIKTIREDVTGNPFCIKTEEIEIKFENEGGDVPLSSDVNPIDIKIKEEGDLESLHLKNEYIPDAGTYNYCTWNCETTCTNHFTPSQPIHEELSQVHVYKCNMCDYKTKHMSNLTSHQLRHKSASEIQGHKCDLCDYKCKRKSNLISHKLTHKDISQVPMYKCDICSYKTKYKNCLTIHLQNHKGTSEVYLHECNACDFKTKYKSNLLFHQLKHEDFSKMELYKCDKCDYQTRNKTYMKRHLPQHEDISQMPVFKCNLCDFKTKHNSSLKSHQLRHKDLSEVQVYECELCDFKTKRKNNLERHRLRHKDLSNMQAHKCNICRFKTKHRYSLTRHKLQHEKHEREISFVSSMKLSSNESE